MTKHLRRSVTVLAAMNGLFGFFFEVLAKEQATSPARAASTARMGRAKRPLPRTKTPAPIDDSSASVMAPASRYGLALPSKHLSSRFAVAGSEGLASMNRSAASRFSRESLETLSGRGKLLARLASRYRLGIVSNFYGNLAAACAEAGIERNFSVLVDSTDIGVGKPLAHNAEHRSWPP